MTTIEITGANSQNLGSRLMLHAVVRALRSTSSELGLAVWGGTVDAEDVWSNRLDRVVTDRVRAGPRWSALAAPLRLGGPTGDAFRGAHGLLSASSLDGLVDISGFALSDQRGVGRAMQLARLAESHAEAGRPVVLLPQSFGPFEEPDVADASRRAIAAADLVVARDRTSFEHLGSLGVDRSRLLRSPDITFGVTVEPMARPSGDGVVLLVPNRRVVSDTRTSWTRHSYVRALAAVARRAHDRGRRVDVLLHSSEEGDAAIGSAAAEAAGVPVGCLAPDDPLTAKRMLAGAEVVVASRYHAAVGALSSGVPTIVVGWSHKYAELLADLGVAELLATDESTEVVVDRLDDVLERPDVAGRLGPAASAASAELSELWARTREVLGLPSSVGT